MSIIHASGKGVSMRYGSKSDLDGVNKTPAVLLFKKEVKVHHCDLHIDFFKKNTQSLCLPLPAFHWVGKP